MIDDAVESLRDDVEASIRNLHCEVLRQLQLQRKGSLVEKAILSTTLSHSMLENGQHRVQHRVENGQFVTRVAFGLKPELFQSKPNSELNLLPPIAGLHVGIVKKLDADPSKKNRIQVLIPSLKSTGNGVWAMLGHFHAGKNSGSFFVPELNSEVIVGFINDDPRFPVVLGALYSKNNTTKEKFTKDVTVHQS